MEKSPEAFRTISEVAELLSTPAHVLRFWESRFTQIRPVKRAGGRRYYRPSDVALLAGIRSLLHDQGMTIRGVQKVLREQGVRHVCALGTDQGLLAEAHGEWAEIEAIETTAIVPPPPAPAPQERVVAFPGPRGQAAESGLSEGGEATAGTEAHWPVDPDQPAQETSLQPIADPVSAIEAADADEDAAEPTGQPDQPVVTGGAPPSGLPLFQFLTETWKDQTPEPDDPVDEGPEPESVEPDLPEPELTRSDLPEADLAESEIVPHPMPEVPAEAQATFAPPDAAALAARLRRLSPAGVDVAPLVPIARRLRNLRQRMQAARESRG